MFVILFFTVAGFIAGLAYVMIKRKIRPGAVLSAAFLGLVTAAVFKAVNKASKGSGKFRQF
jgi:membrane associated rhomboid family serine protease